MLTRHHRQGEWVAAGDPVVTLQVEAPYLRVEVPEERLSAFPVGGSVTVWPQARPDARFAARVVSIKPRSEFATRKNWGLQSRDLQTFSVRLAPQNAGVVSGQTFVVEAGRTEVIVIVIVIAIGADCPLLTMTTHNSQSSNDSSIEADNLTKRFGDVRRRRPVSFSVRAGETYGLLGPNGAGKTTLIRMLTTLLPPTSGHARVEGHDIVSDKSAVRAAIGTVSQAETTDENLTVRENLSVQGKMYGLWGRTLSGRIERRLHQVGLWERRDQIARQLSGGMRRRLEIARGVLHSPHVLFLDEPTTGLDPQSRRAIWDMLDEMNASRRQSSRSS